MIIRKPYAFLIKYFNIIHIILFACMLYLVIKTRGLYIFFRDFSRTGIYTYVENMALVYIKVPMILISLFLVIVLLLVYLLMKQKEKKVLYYLLAIIYYFISFVLFIFFIYIFNRLEFRTYSNQVLVLLRDLSMIVYYLNYFFLVIAFVRGFGFNVKKFNFERDLKDLDITEADREEIEVSSGIDYENVSNFLRRRKRNFKYYLKENSTILIIFLVVSLLLAGAYITLNHLVVNKVYKERESVLVNGILYTIQNSYLTNQDLYGEEINKDKFYLIIKYSSFNKTKESKNLEIGNSRIRIGDTYYYPKENITSKFLDLGTIYQNQSLKKDSSDEYILIFEVTDLKKDIVFELFTSKKASGEKAIYYYQEILLEPKRFTEFNLGEYHLNDKINLEKTYLKDKKIMIKNFQIIEKETYKYQKCIANGVCQEFSKEIVGSGMNKLLKIEYEGDSKALFYYLNLKDQNRLVSRKEIQDITPDDYQESSLLFEIPSTVNNDTLHLYFNIRGAYFSILKT